MAKISTNSITSIAEDWGADSRNGLPYSGQAVLDFIKEGISTANTAFAERTGAQYFDPSTYTLYSFKNEEDRDLWVAGGSDSLIISQTPFQFSGTQNQVKVINNMDSTNLYFTTAQQEAFISVSFVSQQKGITDVNWEEVLEDFIVTVAVDKGATGTFTPIVTEQLVLNGNSLSVDVKKYIASGANRVRFTAKGATTGTTGNLIFSVNVTSMYLSPSNFTWNKPFVEGETYLLGGMNIGGNIQKTLKVKVSGNEYEKLYEENIGTATYVTNAYFYKGLEFPTAGTGTYKMEIWLDANGLESDHLIYNIMCISASEVNTAQIVCINEISTSASNGTSTEIMKYAVYSKGAATASPTVTLEKDDVTIVEEILYDVATSAVLSYSTALEIESEESSFEILVGLELGTSIEMAYVNVDNTASFPAVSDASFYMNAATRSNNQSNRESIVNIVDGSDVSATWTGMSWAEGVDGWTVDNDGRKCLRIPAGSEVNIAKQLLAYVGNGKTFEIAYKVSNVANYEENIITLATNPSESSFQGIRVKPKKITVHSRDLKTNDDAQSYPVKDEEFVHLLVTIVKNYKTNYGNICTIYVNGGKKCSFEFISTDTFATAANLIIGSELSDLFIYKVRMYDNGFGWLDAAQNFINCLPTQIEKMAAWNKITAAMDDSFSVNYDAVYGKVNTMVIEMKDDAVLPDVLHPAGGNCDLWINILNPIEGELDEDFARLFSGIKIENEVIEGQGTTAMTYYRWNFRWKLSSAWNKRRITAKKNTASSMQDHKMGATRLFNDLHNEVVGVNEAGGRVAVFQYPVYGFIKQLVEGTTDQYTYTFCGLYTIGPDKGDKTTFGYDKSEYENSTIHLEGTDHTPTSVGMDYPWSETRFDYTREAMGAILSSTSIDAAWEVGMAGEYDTDKAAGQEGVLTMLDNEFRPAYEVAYNNSTAILGVTETLDVINEDVATWRSNTTTEGKSYSGFEFWTDDVYDLYYYNVQDKVYKANGVNLLTQLGIDASALNGMTVDEKNEYFKTKRREAFKTNMGNYWHQDDCIFHYTFCMMFAATDNFKKNSYPYKFASLSDGGKWRWRQDDLDTIFDINNQGFSAKLFSVLVGDQTSTGSGSVFRGDNSIFWTLIGECFKDEIKDMVHRIMSKMDELSPYGQSTLDRCVGYIKSLFWDKAQEYFGEGSYNADAEWTYEEAWYLRNQGKYNNDVHPLQQSLGSHYEAERDWVELRIVFLASYFNFGPFAVDNGDDTSTGQISFRAASGKTYTITPAIDLNPTILIGQSTLTSANERVKAGTSVDVTVDDMGNNDTHIYIQGADYYSDLGDLSDIQVSADNPVLTVSSKRLRKLKAGDETAENVTSNVATLTVGDCPCMEEIDARNLTSLTGTVNLSQCPRLKKAHFSGTNAANVQIPEGSKLTELSLPGSITTLSLIKLLNLTDENLTFDDLSNIAYIRIENNDNLGGFELLKNAYENSSDLTNIRIVGFDAEGDATDVDMIAAFATATDENGNRIYYGIDDEGNATVGLPILDGSLTITSPVYSDTLEIVTQYYPNLEFAATVFYVRFADPEVSRIVAETWGDGTGTTLEQIQAVTKINSEFKGNTVIETFDEFEKFTGVNALPFNSFANCTALTSISLKNITSFGGGSVFYGCSSLKEISFPSLTGYVTGSCCTNCVSLTKANIPIASGIGQTAFKGCTALNQVYLGNTIKDIQKEAFYNCTSLVIEDLSLPNLEILGQNAFYGVSIKKISDLGKITALPAVTTTSQNFGRKDVLEEVVLPDSVTIIPANSFDGYSSLVKVHLSDSVTEIGNYAFRKCVNIEQINIPNSVEILGRDAFYNNTKLNGDLTLLAIKTIGESGLRNTSFSSVETGSSIEEVGSNAFMDCSKLNLLIFRAITPPTLGSNAFNNTNNCPIYVPDASVEAYKTATNWVTYASRIQSIFYYLGYIDFADSAVRDICVANFDTDADGVVSMEEAAAVTDIGNLFKGSSIVTFNEFKYFTGVTSIGNSAFEIGSLEQITLPSSVTTIGQNPFRYASKLDLTFLDGSNVTKIEGSIAPYNTTSKTFVIPEKLTTVGWGPLANTKVEKLIFKNTSNINGVGEFRRGDIIKEIEVSELCFYKLHNGCLYDSNFTTLYFYVWGYENIESVTKIGDKAFLESTFEQTELTIPSNITIIGADSFRGLKGVDIIRIPSTVTNIGASAFVGTSCKRLYIDQTNLDGYKYNGNSSLEYVNCGTSLTTIANTSLNNCPKLNTLILNSEIVVSLADTYALNGTLIASGTGYIYVPDNLVDAYKVATNWSAYASQIKPLSEYVES